ncbi:ribosomal-processing cysteine protease Prp [Halanaerocella petrolearia]
MIKINIERDKRGNIYKFSAQGHAEYAPQGEDIICAAVSAIMQTAVFGLQSYLDVEPLVDTNNGWLSCQLDPKLARDEKVKAILETMLVGLKETAKVHSKYLKIIIGGEDNA